MVVVFIVMCLLLANVACGGVPANTPEPTVAPEFNQQDATFLVQEKLERGDGCVPPYDNWWRREYWREEYQGDGTWSVYWADPGLPNERYEWQVIEESSTIQEIANPFPDLC